MLFLVVYLVCTFITMLLYFMVNEEESNFIEALYASLFWPVTAVLTITAVIADVLVKKLEKL